MVSHHNMLSFQMVSPQDCEVMVLHHNMFSSQMVSPQDGEARGGPPPFPLATPLQQTLTSFFYPNVREKHAAWFGNRAAVDISYTSFSSSTCTCVNLTENKANVQHPAHKYQS